MFFHVASIPGPGPPHCTLTGSLENDDANFERTPLPFFSPFGFGSFGAGVVSLSSRHVFFYVFWGRESKSPLRETAVVRGPDLIKKHI